MKFQNVLCNTHTIYIKELFFSSNSFVSDYAYKYVRRYTVRFGWLENFHEPGHRDDTR